jgi:hypothetical protein
MLSVRKKRFGSCEDDSFATQNGDMPSALRRTQKFRKPELGSKGRVPTIDLATEAAKDIRRPNNINGHGSKNLVRERYSADLNSLIEQARKLGIAQRSIATAERLVKNFLNK